MSFRNIMHAFVQKGAVVPIFDGLNLEIPAGQFVAVVGPSGCGKTTLLGMCCGLLRPRVGDVLLEGQPLVGRAPSEAAYMPARDALMPWRNALENAEFGLEARGVRAEKRTPVARDWLQRVGLGRYEHAAVDQLSQGMRQRVAIARTLALSPKLLLMDEPFAALDAQTRILLQEEFLQLWEQTRPTVLFITHDLAEAIKLADRVVLLGESPTKVISDVEVRLPRPRPPDVEHVDPLYQRYFTELWSRLKADVNSTARRAGWSVRESGDRQ